MLRRSRTFVVATIVLLISISLLTIVGNAPPKGVSAAPGQATQAPTTAATKERGQSKPPHFGRDARIPVPGYESMGPELEKTLKVFGVDTPAAKFFDLDSADYAINADANTLSSITVGLCNSGSADITVLDRTTPDDKLPAKIIGAAYEPSLAENTMVLVYVKGQTPPLRFYVENTQVPNKNAIAYVERHFVGQLPNAPRTQAPPRCSSGQAPAPQAKGNHPTQFDEGTISSAGETCFTVGLTQECYRFNPTNSQAVQELEAAYKRFQAINDKTKLFPNFNQVQFDFAGAVADVKGDKQRGQCADNKDKQQWSDKLPGNCRPTVYFAGLTGYTTTKQVPTLGGNSLYAKSAIIGFLTVLDDQGLIFDSNNNPDFPGGLIDKTDADKKTTQSVVLPKGDYVWIDTQPNVLAGGSSTLIELDANGVAYQHPAYHLEAFGSLTNPPPGPLPSLDPRLPAYVKDGGAGGAGCP